MKFEIGLRDDDDDTECLQRMSVIACNMAPTPERGWVNEGFNPSADH